MRFGISATVNIFADCKRAAPRVSYLALAPPMIYFFFSRVNNGG